MTRSLAVLVLLASVALHTPARSAGAADAMLNAEVWYLQFEVTLTGTGRAEYTDAENGKAVAHAVYEHHASGMIKYDMRTPGLSLSMMTLGNLPAAEQQKASMDMVMRTDQCATWMPGDPMAQLEPAGSSRMTYRYDCDIKYPPSPQTADQITTKTVAAGEAKVKFMSQPMFEIDTTKNEYRLMMPYAPGDDNTESVKYETTVTTVSDGVRQTDVSTRTRSVEFPQLTFVTAFPAGGFGGTFDPAAGKVTGSYTFDVTFDTDIRTVPGKLVITYTMTMTPPRPAGE